jgi:hypothetical protein
VLSTAATDPAKLVSAKITPTPGKSPCIPAAGERVERQDQQRDRRQAIDLDVRRRAEHRPLASDMLPAGDEARRNRAA